jgi:16S rRNA (uracil1498-N3)-methyltransferase
MSLHRFYLPAERWAESSPELDPADAHHCTDVLRLGVGDAITIFDGQGKEALAILTEVTRKRAHLAIGEHRVTLKPRCAITLAQAVPKGKNMDLVIQKAVELGAAALIPLLSERTVVRLEGAGDAARKQERWQSIALEACKQCGQNWMPEVGLPRTMKEFFSNLPKAELLLIASLQPHSRPVKEVIASFEKSNGTLPASVVILIGPEGDFTPEETAQALSAGVVPITLGPIILRTETAALYCLSVLGHELF